MLGFHLTDAGRLKAIARKTLAKKKRRRRLLLESLEDRRLLAGNQPPNVLSVVRADSNPTNAAALHFTVTFDEPVRFVEAADFQLISGGSVSGATLAQVIPQTANTFNSVYTVAVNSGSGDGTLKLNVLDDNTIRDQQGDRLGGNGPNNGAFTSGESYTIDKTGPTVTNISLIGTPTTSALTIEYNVTFSEAVSGVNTGDFQLITTGLTGSVINSVSGSGMSYVVQVAVGSGAGTVQLALVDDDSIIDVATNALGGTGTGSQVNGPTHSVESVAPIVTSIVAAQPNPTNAALVDFSVTFSEPVLNVGLNDFALTIGGGITGAMITNVAGTSDTFIVTVSTGSGDGTIRLGMFNLPTITDLGGNPMGTSSTTSTVITIDKTMPTMSQSLLDQSPTNAASVRYQVTFSEPVTGLSTSNLQAYVLNPGTPNLSGLSITSIAGSGATYVVTIATGTGNGTIGLRIVNDGNFKDTAGNAPTVLGGSGAAYVIDRIAPIVESVVLENVSPTNSASMSFLVTLSEPVSVFHSSNVTVDQVGLPSALVSSVQNVTGTQKRVIVAPGIGEGTVSIDILPQTSAVDFAGNQLATPANNFGAYTVDTRKPSVSSISLVGPTATNASSIAFNVSFSESVSNVTAADFALAVSGITGAAITGIVGGGTSYTVTVGTGTFNGTIRLNATNSGTLRDALGNPLAANFTGAVATIDRSAPTVLSISTPTSTANATNIDYSITFSEPVTGLTASDLSLVTGGTITSASIASLQGSGSVYTVSVNTGNGDGTVGLNINASTAILDAVGNHLTTGFIGNVVTVDKSLPTITTFASATSLLTNLSNIYFDVIFSEPVLGLDIADLTLTTNGLTGASIGQITGNGTTYSIRVSTGTGDGNARLALATLPTITDIAGNAFQAVSLQSELVTIDKTTPTSMTITGVSPAGVTVTNATSMQYEVVFAEPVTGITSTAFYPHTDQTGNLNGLSVSSVSGSGTTYLVTIGIISGNRGPLLLGIDNSAGLIKDLAGNAIAYIQGSGFNYVIDRVAPEVEFIRRASTSPTASTTLMFDVFFNEAVTGVDATDFALSTTGVSGATINSVTGIGTSYTITVTHTGGIGTVALNLVDDNSIVDPAYNMLGGSLVGDGNFAGEVYAIASSTITGMVYSDFDGDGLRDAVDAGLPGVPVYLDIDGNGVRNVGEPSAVTATSPAGQFTIGNLDAGTYQVRVDAVGNTRQSSPLTTADGTKPMTLVSNLVPPTGRTGNSPTSIAVSPDSNFAFFATSSTGRVGSLVRNPVDGLMTLVNELQNTSRYSEIDSIAYHPGGKFVYAASRGLSVVNVFSVATNGTITFVEAQAQSNNTNINQPREILVTPDGSQLIIAAVGSGSVLVYAINQTTGQLTLSQTFKQGVGGVTGIPSVSYITISPDGGLIAVRNFHTDNSVQFFNRNVVTGVISIGQSGITIPNPNPNLYFVYDLQFSPDGKHLYVSDDAGKIYTLNRDPVTGVVSLGGSTSTGAFKANLLAISPDGSSLVATSEVGDAVMQFARDATTGELTLLKTFLNNLDVSGLDQPFGIGISPDGADVYVMARASDRLVQFELDQSGRMASPRSVTLAANQIRTGINFSIATASPVVTSFASATVAPITTTSIDFDIQFSEPVTGVTPAAFRIYSTTIAGATIASVTGSGTNWTVTVETANSEGFVQLEIIDNDLILDADSVSLGGPGTGGVVARSERVFADSLAPSVVAIATGTNVPAGATSVELYVSFREPVTGFDATDLSTSATGNVVSTLLSVTPTVDPQVYVAAVGITGNSGTVTLALVDNDTIVDSGLNVLGGVGISGAGNGSFVSAAVVIDAPKISGVIWEDLNQNGLRDPGEGGLADVIVFVDLNDNGSRDTGEPFVVSQTDNVSTSDVNETGRYLFSGLEAATTYSILVDAPVLTQFNPIVYSQDNGLLAYKDEFIAKAQPDISLLSAETVIASADGRHLYTTSLNGHTLGVFARDFANDTFMRVQSINSFSPGFSGLNFPRHFTLTPDGRFGYLGSADSIYVVSRDSETGLLTFTSKLNPGDAGPTGLTGSTAFVASPDGRWLYANGPTQGFSVFAIDQVNGSLTLMQQFVNGINGVSGLNSVQNVDVTPDGSQVFVTTNPDRELQIFNVTPGTGRLVLAQRISNIFNSEDVAFSPDGNFAYLALTDLDYIYAYSRNAVTGIWNYVSQIDLNPGDASSIDMSRDGRFVYVADEVSHSITVLQRNTTSGALTVVQSLLDQAPHSALSGIRQVIVTPEGKEAFAVSYNDGALTRFSRVGGTKTAVARIVNTKFANNDGGDFGVFNPAPMVTSISTTATSPHLAAQISFDVEFSEGVINVTAADFTLTTTGALTGMSIGAITGTGNTRNVVVNYGGGSGTVRLDLIADETLVDVGGKTVEDAYTSGSVVAVGLPKIMGTIRRDVDQDGLQDLSDQFGIVGRTVYLDTNNNSLFDAGEPTTTTLADDPLTTTINETGRFAFTISSYGDYRVGLLPLAGWSQTSPVTNDLFNHTGSITSIQTPSSSSDRVYPTPDGNHVYAVDQSVTAGLSGFVRDWTTGLLTAMSSFSLGAGTSVRNPADVSFSPDSKWMIALEGIVDVVKVLERNGSTGALTLAFSATNNAGGFSGIDSPERVAVSKDGSTVYVYSRLSRTITVFAMNNVNGALTQLQTLPLVGAASLTRSDLVITPDDKQVLFADESSNRVYVYSRDPLSGELTLAQTLVGNTLVQAATGTFNSPTSLAISPNGNFVYVSSGAGRRVDGFARNTATGAISIPSTIGVYNGNEVGSLAISPDGLSIIETRANVSQTVVSSLDPTTGAMTSTQLLAHSTGSPASLRFLSDVSFSPDGRHVYSTAPGNGAMGSFARQVGALQSVSHVVALTASNHIATTDFLTGNAVPKANSITQVGSPSTNAATRQYTVTFSEAVTGVDTSDFEVLPASFTSASISSVTGSGTTYEVTVSVGANVGNLQLRLVDNDTIVDIGSEPLGGIGFGGGQPGDGSLTSSSIFVDTVPPLFVSIVADQPLHNSLASVSYTVTFSESIFNYSGKFSLEQVGVSGALVSSVVSLSSFQYRVNITTGTGDGTLRLLLPDNDTVTDGYGNPLNGVGSSLDVLNALTYRIERNPLRGFSGKLYSDANRNQTLDSSEIGIAGVKIYSDVNNNGSHDATEPNVLTSADNPATVEFNEAGNYTLGNFALGTYRLRTEIPAGYFSSTASTSTITTVITSPLLTNVDLALEPNLTAIRGAVFSDLNSNGLVDNAETGLAGVTVYRDLNNNGVLDAGEPSQLTPVDDPATTEINETGTFDFGQLAIGTNRVRIQVPANYIATSPTLFSSNVVTSIDTFNNVSFLLHENLTTVSGLLYDDLNSNGTQDAGEGPLSGLVVYVDSDRDGVRDTGEKFTTSAADGSYTINNVTPGDILIRVVTVGQTTVTSPTFQSERLFVSSGATLREINSTTGAQISSFSVVPVPTRGATSGGLAFNGTSVFMLDRVDNRILVINPNTGVVTSALGPLPTAFYGGLAFVNSLLYASDNTNERILAINPATGIVVSTFNIATLNAGTPFYNGTIDLLAGLGESADGTKLLAGTASTQRLIINPTTGIVEGAYTDAANDRDLGIAGGAGRIFVGRRDTNSVQIYNAAGTLTSTLNNVSTPDDVAASGITFPGANLTVVLDQQVSGINFGIGSSVGTITGRQYDDANNNGSFDAGDTPLAGVKVFVDSNNNNWPDATEPQAISVSDGTYSISGVSPGSNIIRAVSPNNARPADSYPTANRLFGMYIPSGSPVVYLRELNPVTGAVLSTVPTTIPVVANAPFIEVAFDGERLFYFDSFHDIAYELALDGTVLEQRPLGQLLSTGVFENVVDFGPVAIHGTIYSVRGTGLSMKLVRYDAEINDFIDVRPVTFDWDVTPIGSSTTIPTGYYASSASTDGNSIVVATTDDRVLTIDPTTGIATFSAVPSFSLPTDFARETLANETFIASNGSVRVEDAAGNLVRTISNTPIYYALGGGLYRDQHAGVTVVAGQTLNNVDLRFKSTLGSLSGTIASSPVGGASGSPVDGAVVYLDVNRNSALDLGEPQTTTNSSGHYVFNGLEPGDYYVRQVPLGNQTVEANATSYNRLFTRTFVNDVATIAEIDPFTGEILRQFPSPGSNTSAAGIAMKDDSLFLVHSGSMYRIDANTGVLLSSWAMPFGQLDGLAVIGSKAYALQTQTNTIHVVDLAKKQVERTMNIASLNPSYSGSITLSTGLGESADGLRLAARNGSNMLIIDPVTGLIVDTQMSTFPGAAIAGAGAETYEPGTFSGNAQLNTDARDSLGLIRRRFPFPFAGVNASGFAADNVQATEHRVHVFAEQALSGLDFDNLEQGTISGTQYVDANENGVFDAGDTPLAGVTVYLDLNNNNFPDASEPQTVSAGDGTYTITNLPSGSDVLRTISPDNHIPAGSHSTQSRLFSTRNLTDATSSTGLRLNLFEISPTNGTIIGQVATSIETTGQQSLAYDGETIIITDNFRHKLVEMATDGTIVDDVDLPSVGSTPVAVMGPVVVEGTIYLLTYDNGLGYTWRTFDKHTNEFSGAKLLVLPENPPYGNPFMTIALSESPDGKSALAFDYQSQRVYVIDPRSATVTQDLSTNNAPSDFYATASIGGNVLVNSSGGRLAVLDAEYRYLKDLSTVSIYANGLGAGEYTDYGQVITAAAGVALTEVNQGYRSTVARDGTLDPTFGNSGITTTEFFHKQSTYEAVHGVAIDEFGRTLAVGDGGYLVRYASDGSVDTTFGSDGYARFPGSAVDVAVTTDRRIVVVGSSFDGASSRFVVARYLPNGRLDETFGDAGVRTTSFTDYRVVASAVEIAPDGRIVVTGTGRNASNTDYDFVSARYLADGSLDTSFDGDGRVSTSIGTFDFANDIAVQLDGSIVVVGSARIGAQDDVAIVHYLPSGSLNTSFGTAGIRTTDFGGADDEARSVVVEPSGRFTIAGRTKVGNQFDIALARYTYNGLLDASFDTDGLVTTDFAGNDDAGHSIAIQSNGNIVVTGEASLLSGFTDVAVLRYTSAGLLDSAFDTDGKLTTDFGGESDLGNRVVIDASGKIVVAGAATLASTYYDFALLRYNSDGSLDTSFDTDGKVTTAIRTSTDEAASVAVLANGSFVLAGSAQNANKDFALSRHSAFGHLDYGFGTDGRVTTPIGSGDDLVRRVIETPTGKLIAVGRAQFGSNWNVALAQYNSNGSLDSVFGTGGIIVTDFGSADDDAVDVAVDSVGNIYVAGHRSGVNGMDIVVARYGVDGVLSSAFGTGGFVTTSLGASDEFAAKLAVQFDDKFVLAGYTTANSNIDMLVARFNSDGTFDTAFDSDGIALIDFGSDDYAQSVTVSYNGKITVAGASGTSNALDFALARLTPSGSSDSSFGVAGKVTTDFSGNVDVIRDIATAEDGKLVATGFTHNGTNIDFALARYTTNGVLDTGFATGGKSSTGIGPNDDYAHAIAFDSGGEILVAGSAHVGASTDFAVARYTNTSSVDVAIDQHGNLIVNDHEDGGVRTISFDGTSIIVTDPTGTLTTAVGEAVVVSPQTLAIPLSIVSGSVLYRGGDGLQTLTVSLSTGPISRPISVTDTFDNLSGSISLELIGDVNAANVVHSVSGPLSGSIAITGNSLVTYSATQTVNQLLSAQNVTLNFPDIAKSQSLSSDGLSRVRLLGSQSPQIHLAVPSQSLNVHIGGGVQNTLEISDLNFAVSTRLFIDGNSIDDEIIVSGPVSLSGGDFSLSADTIDVLAPVSTSGGDISWASTGNIRLGDLLTTDGGNVSITADSDANGSGLFQIQPTIATKYANPQLVKPNDPAAGDWFGSAVAVSGDTAFIAADGDQEHGNDSGSVYVFTKIAGVWTQTQKITPTDGAALEYFGYPLAMSGDTVVFSAQRQDVGGVVDAGAAYVYRNVAGTWTFEQKLTANDADAQDWFATRVAIQGNTIVVTAPQDNEAAFLAGAVYVFTRTGNVWTQTQKLTASDASASLQLGDSLAIDDDTIIVGASKDTHSGTLSGSAYVFTKENGVWTQSQKLTAFVPTSFDEFGHSVAIDGDSLLVGAKSHDADGVVNTGAAFAFIRENGFWKPQSKLVHEGALESNHLGIAVSLVGDTAVVGSLGGGGISNAYGAAFTFVRHGDTWYQQAKYTTGEASDFYSFAVAHDASTAVVGAYLANSPLSDAGSAYFYDSVASSDIGGSINVGSGNLSLTSATIELLGRVAGTGTLLMQPSQSNASIGLGGAAGTFNIDDFELSQVSDGFSLITIGNAAAGTGTVSVSSSTFNDPVVIAGGTLREEQGGITAPSITLLGNISPGNSPGLMHLDAIATIASGSTVTIEYAGTAGPGLPTGHDQVVASSNFHIEPNVTLALIPIGTSPSAGPLTIVKRTGGSGTFASIPEGHVFTNPFGSGQDFQLTYVGGDGDDIVLVGHSAPTDITLSSSSINENVNTSNTDVLFATLGASDPDTGETHTYSLANGNGDLDNNSFRIVGNQLFVKQGTALDFETKQNYLFRLRATDSTGLSVEKALSLQVNNLIEVQKSNVRINDGSVQRSRVDSVTIEFDTDVILQEGAITVHKRGAGGGVVGTILSPIVGVASRTFTLNFAGAFTEFGSLADGNYELRVDATKIVSVGGFGLDTNKDGITGDDFVFGNEATDKFFRYFGDIDGSRSLNLVDYTAFRNAYGKAIGVNGYRSDLDFNQDGLSNLVDFTQFRNRYGSSLLF